MNEAEKLLRDVVDIQASTIRALQESIRIQEQTIEELKKHVSILKEGRG